MADPLDQYFRKIMTAPDPSVSFDDELRAIVRAHFSDSAGETMRQAAKNALKSPGEGLKPSERFNQDLAEIALRNPHLLMLGDARARFLAAMVNVATGMKEPGQQQSRPITDAQLSNVNTATSGPCAHCGKTAVSTCGGCKEAPKVLERTFYCNANCQKTDWPRHKPLCTRLQQRIVLYRAASMLRELLCRLRTTTFQHDVDKIEEKHGILYMYTTDKKIRSARDGLFPFMPLPTELIKSQEVEDALLFVQGCSQHVRDAYIPIRSFLEGTNLGEPLRLLSLRFVGHYTDIQEVSVRVKNARRPTVWVKPDGRPHNNMFHRHALLRVTLKSGEVYCVDPTAAQYGWEETVVPWDEFLATHCLAIRDTQPFGTEFKDAIKSAKRDHGIMFFGSIGHALAAGVLTWSKTEGIDFNTMLKLPNAGFEENRGRMIQFATMEMSRFLDQLKQDKKWAMIMECGEARLRVL